MGDIDTPRVLSTAEAAALCQMTAGNFRVAMSRARKQGTDLRLPGPDLRTPLWDAEQVQNWLANRPGSGRRNANRDAAGTYQPAPHASLA